MGDHDSYGKAVMRKAVGSQFRDSGPAITVRYGERGGARIDGVVGEQIAVEIESRTSKQVRGAILDLILHDYPRKLLVLLPVHQYDAELCRAQCQAILGRFLEQQNYRVVVLRGTGFSPTIDEDTETIGAVLRELGFDHSKSGQ